MAPRATTTGLSTAVQLGVEPGMAGVHLGRRRSLVDAPLAAQLVLEVLDGVRHVQLPTIDPGRPHALPQHSAGGTDERFALEVLTVTGLLADQRQACRRGPRPNTVCVAGSNSGQPVHDRAADSSVSSDREGGTNGSALICALVFATGAGSRWERPGIHRSFRLPRHRGTSGAMSDEPGVPSDNTTLAAVLADYESAGFGAQFELASESAIMCVTCGVDSPPGEYSMHSRRRLEGASDPDDMMSVVAVCCPRCDAQGTIVLGFGPTASSAEAAVSQQLRDHLGEGTLPPSHAPNEDV